MTASWATHPGKRVFDLLLGALALLFTLPLTLLALAAVWIEDRHNPLYVSTRVGCDGVAVRFIKIRTMIPQASLTAVDTTVAGDPRITWVGRYIRALKLDELPQLLHVVSGRMSLVGPRPNVPREVALYTEAERDLLRVAPGITDIASIVFADLAKVLSRAADANIAYNQLVRPWKSRLGLHYVHHASLGLDVAILFCTFSLLFDRRRTLQWVSRLLARTGASSDLVRFALRDEPLRPLPPPGAAEVVISREHASSKELSS